MQRIQGQSEEEVAAWRQGIQVAVGPNGRLITEAIPRVTLIIGDQPPVATLPLEEAQTRFQLVFRVFLGVYTRPEHLLPSSWMTCTGPTWPVWHPSGISGHTRAGGTCGSSVPTEATG